MIPIAGGGDRDDGSLTRRDVRTGAAFFALSAVAIAAVVGASPAGMGGAGLADIPGAAAAISRTRLAPPATPPPSVEPVALQPIAPADAVAANAAIPFAPSAIAAATPLRFAGDAADRGRAIDCLTSAVLYEAGDDQVGQRAVAQVVVNRARHPAFPATICGVVFQGSERATGCQFTFTCDGALGRSWSDAAWIRARMVATEAIGGRVDPTVGLATHYHTDWVRPSWSDSLTKLVAVGTHLFFRWPGGWGEPRAFRSSAGAGEPSIAKLAARFAAHRGAAPSLTAVPPDQATVAESPRLDARGLVVADRVSMIGTVAPARPSRPRADGGTIARSDPTGGGRTIHLTLDPSASAESHYALAIAQCGDRGYCKVLGWVDAAQRPAGDMLTDAQRAAMTFSYLRDQAGGLERALWNCAVYPRADRRQCMRR